ncbi:MAG: Calx-beta domain-containing protein, partial [Methylococcaceae bacterium]
FTVSGVAGQLATLSLQNGSGTVGADTGPGLEYWDGSRWIEYTAAVAIPAGGLKVRVAITNDGIYEGSETVTLRATPAGGTAASGTATITDDGTGTIFRDDGTSDTMAIKDNDTPTLSLGSIIVSEASTHAVVEVSLSNASVSDISFTPRLISGTATVGVDSGATLEYFNGANWVSAAGGVTLAAGRTRTLLRTTIIDDPVFEGSETFTLRADNIGGMVSNSWAATGTVTIKDDGSSRDVFTHDSSAATPVSGSSNDDRSLTVSSPIVNEASPFAIFKVDGFTGQSITLTLGVGSATAGIDYTTTLEISSDGGTGWSTYGSGPAALNGNNGSLLARIPIRNDSVYEGPETFSLTATVVGGTSSISVATINDEAGGTIFRPDASIDISTPRDDDRDVDGIEHVVEESLATQVADLGISPNARPGDLNGDGIMDGRQSAVTILAWITVDKFEAAVNRTLVDTKPIISIIVTRPDGAVEDTAQLSNVRVLNPTDRTVGGSRPIGPNLSTAWDPLQFSITPEDAAASLRDSDASRLGTQTEVVIDVSRSGVTTRDFNGYMKYVAQDVLDAYAAQGKTLVDWMAQP